MGGGGGGGGGGRGTTAMEVLAVGDTLGFEIAVLITICLSVIVNSSRERPSELRVKLCRVG